MRHVGGIVGLSTMVRIGNVRLTRLRRVRAAVVRQYTFNGVKPSLFVEVHEAGRTPVVAVHPPNGMTPDERWLHCKVTVAQYVGVPLPAVEFFVEPDG